MKALLQVSLEEKMATAKKLTSQFGLHSLLQTFQFKEGSEILTSQKFHVFPGVFEFILQLSGICHIFRSHET